MQLFRFFRAIDGEVTIKPLSNFVGHFCFHGVVTGKNGVTSYIFNLVKLVRGLEKPVSELFGT